MKDIGFLRTVSDKVYDYEGTITVSGLTVHVVAYPQKNKLSKETGLILKQVEREEDAKKISAR